jgi:hypothetical protein
MPHENASPTAPASAVPPPWLMPMNAWRMPEASVTLLVAFGANHMLLVFAGWFADGVALASLDMTTSSYWMVCWSPAPNVPVMVLPVPEFVARFGVVTPVTRVGEVYQRNPYACAVADETVIVVTEDVIGLVMFAVNA